jgi:hypothetical protein
MVKSRVSSGVRDLLSEGSCERAASVGGVLRGRVRLDSRCRAGRSELRGRHGACDRALHGRLACCRRSGRFALRLRRAGRRDAGEGPTFSGPVVRIGARRKLTPRLAPKSGGTDQGAMAPMCPFCVRQVGVAFDNGDPSAGSALARGTRRTERPGRPPRAAKGVSNSRRSRTRSSLGSRLTTPRSDRSGHPAPVHACPRPRMARERSPSRSCGS